MVDIERIEHVFVESAPFTDLSGRDGLDDEHAALPVSFRTALWDLYDHPDAKTCWNCGSGVGFELCENAEGFERLEWTPTGLARVGEGPVLCDGCSPYVPTEPAPTTVVSGTNH